MKLNNLRYDPRLSERERANSRRSSRYLAIKMLFIAHKGYKCEACDEYHNVRSLSFHHLEGNDKEKDISKMIHKYRSCSFTQKAYDDIMLEVDKCILLCENCHQQLHEFEVYNSDVYNNSIKYITGIQEELKIKGSDRFDIREFRKMYDLEYRSKSNESCKNKLEPRRSKVKPK